ncbi:hypothetical protein M404DRAFT_815789 [Pisolithus tinctorius Marx 270]|uniref:Uncharacterized protein n=1 Tax=Pisolithus tinctorius Marx 270 TaxID=870435 RepID=A0A0C3NVQ9_PISTI|nr:hypothetical protein M404DRAFT_815789 [Pisolithus tinctorius Marx 270]
MPAHLYIDVIHSSQLLISRSQSNSAIGAREMGLMSTSRALHSKTFKTHVKPSLLHVSVRAACRPRFTRLSPSHVIKFLRNDLA